MKAATKVLARLLVKLDRGGDLLDPTLVHHHHPVGQGHCLDLIVGDVDDGVLQTPVQLA